MRGAAQRSYQESLAIFWMMRESYRDKKYAEAMRYADLLFRTRPQLSRACLPDAWSNGGERQRERRAEESARREPSLAG